MLSIGLGYSAQGIGPGRPGSSALGGTGFRPEGFGPGGLGLISPGTGTGLGGGGLRQGKETSA